MRASLGLLAFTVIVASIIGSASSQSNYNSRSAKGLKSRHIQKVAPSTWKAPIMPMKNFHKLSMALANGEADPALFGVYGNGKKLNLMRTRPIGGGQNFLKTHASRIHKPIAYQKMNQVDQKERLRTLKMNVLAKAETENENQENQDELQLQGDIPVIENMVISNNNVNIKSPQAEMLRSRGQGKKKQSKQQDYPAEEDPSMAAPEDAAHSPLPLSSNDESPMRGAAENEKIQPVRAIATKNHMKKMQQQQQQDDMMAGSYDYDDEMDQPQRPAKKPLNPQQLPRKPPAPAPKPKQGKLAGKRTGKLQKGQSAMSQVQYDDEDSDVHALKMMRMKKLEQQRMGLSDQATLTMELLNRQNPGMSFLKQYALSNYLSHMG